MVKNFITIFLLCLVFSACSYSVYTSEYPHLKTIHILPFENKTVEYALSQDIQNALVSKFMKDGRLKINSNQADCQISGEIIDYKKKIYSYDNNGSIKEYQLQILISFDFFDNKNNKSIYSNKSLLLSKTYNPSSTLDNVEKTETEALEKIYSDFFDHIIKNTLESW